jgi:hypothetical protein
MQSALFQFPNGYIGERLAGHSAVTKNDYLRAPGQLAGKHALIDALVY